VTDNATVVLVHGAWHGAWCWDKVVALLDDAGITSVAVELPLTGYADDVAAAARAVVAVDGPVVLCGHSYGGAVITGAGDRPNVERLVYLTAFACEEGESAATIAPDARAASTDVDGVFVIDEDGTTVTLVPDRSPAVFYHDCSPEDVASALTMVRSMQLHCLTTPVGEPAWRSKPSTYVVCTEDRAVHPELQRVMAARCTESVDFPTAHSPFLNRPDLVAGLLAELAQG
jgi:pimeloyl-ACP methyl ester carboxylesterase